MIVRIIGKFDFLAPLKKEEEKVYESLSMKSRQKPLEISKWFAEFYFERKLMTKKVAPFENEIHFYFFIKFVCEPIGLGLRIQKIRCLSLTSDFNEEAKEVASTRATYSNP